MKAFSRLLAVLVPVGLLLTAALLWRSHQETESARPVRDNQAAVQPATASVAPAPSAVQKPVAPAPIHVAVAPARVLAPEMAAFEVWVGKFSAASPSEKTALAADGMKLAEARRAAMAQLIQQDPEAALRQALPYRLRKTLPAEIAAAIEQPVSGRAAINEMSQFPVVGDDSVEARSLRWAKVNGRVYQVYGGLPYSFRTQGEGLALDGVAVADKMAVSADPIRLLEPEEAADKNAAGQMSGANVCALCGQAVAAGDAVSVQHGDEVLKLCRREEAQRLSKTLRAAANPMAALSAAPATESVAGAPLASFAVNRTQGPKTLLFIRVKYPDDPTEPATEGESYTLMDEVNRYYVANSFNLFSVRAVVTPVLMMPQPKVWYSSLQFQNLYAGWNVMIAHARVAAQTAGYNVRDYDFDLVRTVPVAGVDNVGGSSFSLDPNFGIVLSDNIPGSAASLLGYALGRSYANAWDVVTPPPDPANPNNYPFAPGSHLPIGDLAGPGTSVRKGDPFDQMGTNGAGTVEYQFNAIGKYLTGWLPIEYVKGAWISSTNRLHAIDSTDLVAGRKYALVVGKDFERNYWIDFRQRWQANPWLANGVELHWPRWASLPDDDPEDGDPDSLLLDTTPNSPRGLEDSAVVVGRTYSDHQADVHVTPVARGGSGLEQWIDVVVHYGPFPTNLPPTATVTASAQAVNVGDTVTFNANATDPNGDWLAYYWDFHDDTLGSNAPVVMKIFDTAGQYVVRCEVSDMKGGLAISYVVVIVGTPATFTMSGQVLDVSGNPLQGALIHDSTQGAGFNWTISDNQGYYTVGNLASNVYYNFGFQYGYTIVPLDFDNPFVISDGDAAGLNHLANPLPVVSIRAEQDADEDGATDGIFTITRTGDVSRELTVGLAFSGDAQAGIQYTPLDPPAVTIPAGETSVQVLITPIADDVGAGSKVVTLTLLMPTSDIRITTLITNQATNIVEIQITNNVTYPGWELIPVNQTLTWFQVNPPFVLGRNEATLRIHDADPSDPPTVSVWVLDNAALESGGDSGSLVFERAGNVDADLTVRYSVAGTAINGVDYERLDGTLTIPAGYYSVGLPVIARNDLFVEGTESVEIHLEPDPLYSVGLGDATVWIVDDDLPLVTIDAPDASAGEANGSTGKLTVTRSGDFSGNLLVNYLVTGTATSGADFQPLAGSITIPAGQVSADITITPLNDGLLEGSETVNVFISDSPTYNIGVPNSVTVIIEDDELPTVSLSITDASATEPGDLGIFTITRTGPTNTSLTVSFQTGGTAISQADYGSIGTNAVIPAGADHVDITIAPANDSFREDSKTVIMQVMPGAAYNLGNPSAGTITLGDDDGQRLPVVHFLLKSSTVPEGRGPAQIAVRLSANPLTTNVSPVFVEYHVVGGSAVNGVNYTLASTGYLRFVRDGPLIQNITVPILSDGIVTPNKTLFLALFDPVGYITNGTGTNITVKRMATNAFVGPLPSHTLTILDTDLNVVTLEATQPFAGETGPTPGLITVRRTGLTNTTQTVTFSVAGTAASRTDFIPFGNTITIPAGTNAAVITVLPVNDSVEEPVETVTVTLTSAPGALIGAQDRATVLIADNDGTVQFVEPTFTVREDEGVALLTVQRTGDTNLLLTVDYRVFDGTATNGIDYRATNGTLTFTPGQVLRDIRVDVLNDSLVELMETVSLVLTNPTGGVPLGGQRTATLLITDDDTAFEFTTNRFRVNENGTNAIVQIRRFGLTNATASVFLTASNGTATSPSDYLATNAQLQFGPGETNLTFLLPIRDDLEFEGNETITLSLSGPSTNASVGAISNAVLTVVDDECAIEFSSAAYSTPEYTRQATLTVHRRGGTVNPVSVEYFTRDVTASSSNDYASVSGTIAFAGDTYVLSTNGGGTVIFIPGETDKTITIPVIDDLIGEGNERFEVVLTNAVGPLVGSTLLGLTNVAVVTIIDNETPGSVEYEYNFGPGANGTVRSVALQSDGKVVFGGDFGQFDNVVYSRIARLAANGFLDTSFNPGFGVNGNVHAMAVGLGDRIILGGDFTAVDNVSRTRIARLNADGSLDLSFDPAGGFNGIVRAVLVQPDGRVLVGGDFFTFDGANRGHLVRLQTNGLLDFTFQASVNGAVNSMARQPDGRIVIGGAFDNVNGSAFSGVARLTASGLPDAGFTPPQVLGAVRGVAVQPDGRIVIGGAFISVGDQGYARLARLDSNGTLDTTFATGSGPDAPVNTVAAQGNGRIIIGGEFTTFNGASRNRFARLRGTGALDPVFDIGTGANAPVLSALVQTNTAVVIGGEFTNVNGIARGYIARIHGEEAMDITEVGLASAQYEVVEDAGSITLNMVRFGNTNTAFTVEFITADVSATAGADYSATNGLLTFVPGQLSQSITVPILDDLLVESNESFVVYVTNITAGVYPAENSLATITIIDNEQSVQLAQPNFVVSEGATNALIRVARYGLPVGTVTVDFSTAGGTAQSGSDFLPVSLSLTFPDGQTEQIVEVPILDDGLIESNETFTVTVANVVGAFLGSPTTATVTIQDNELGPGTVDVTFTPGAGANDLVRALAMQPDGKVIVGGAFTRFDGTNRVRVARLNLDGTLDSTFNPGLGADGLVSSVGVRMDGKIALAGAFTNVNGLAMSRVARLLTNGLPDASFNRIASLNANVSGLSVLSNGNTLVVGAFTLPGSGVARLRNDGSSDVSFNPGTGANGPVHAVWGSPDGALVVGGAFSVIDGVPRRRVARFYSSGLVDPNFLPPSDLAGVVYAVAAQADGKVLIGGDFTSVGGTGRRGIARLNTDGSLDLGFDPGSGADGIVYAIALQADGKVFIGGSFAHINGLIRNRVARLRDNGALDLTFDSGEGPNGTVYATLCSPDGKFVIGGSFTTVNGQARAGVARINGDEFSFRVVSAGFSAGQWRLSSTALPGRSYVLEVSPDLVNWTGVRTNAAAGYSLEMVDSTVPLPASRFYRVRQVLP